VVKTVDDAEVNVDTKVEAEENAPSGESCGDGRVLLIESAEETGGRFGVDFPLRR
jgi:hypothetical protein